MADWTAYAAVLLDLRQQREKIDAAIAAIEALQPSGPAVTPELAAAAFGPTPLAGRFAGMTIADAAMKVLEEAGGPLHVGQILDAITSGGVAVSSADPANTVGSILNRRARERGGIVRVGRGTWAIEALAMNLDSFPLSDDGEQPQPRASSLDAAKRLALAASTLTPFNTFTSGREIPVITAGKLTF